LAAYRDSKLQKWIEEKVYASRKETADAAVEEETKAIVKTGDTAEDIIKNSPPSTVINAADFHLNFNPDAFVERRAPSADEKPLVIYDPEAESTKEVRNASIWLRETAIPNFVVDAVLNLIGFSDGFMLSRLMHRKGINMRYLGVLADQVQRGTDFDFGKDLTKADVPFGLQGLKVRVSVLVLLSSDHDTNAISDDSATCKTR
jgi:protein TIF31